MHQYKLHFLVIFLFISNFIKAEEENSNNISTEIQQLKHPTLQLSDDGKYQWNGAEWIPVNQQ